MKVEGHRTQYDTLSGRPLDEDIQRLCRSIYASENLVTGESRERKRCPTKRSTKRSGTTSWRSSKSAVKKDPLQWTSGIRSKRSTPTMTPTTCIGGSSRLLCDHELFRDGNQMLFHGLGRVALLCGCQMRELVIGAWRFSTRVSGLGETSRGSDSIACAGQSIARVLGETQADVRPPGGIQPTGDGQPVAVQSGFHLGGWRTHDGYD